MKDDGLFNIPPHFPPFRLPDPSSFASSVVVVPRKRSRSMRKLPRQELLTINYSSRYTLSLRSGRSPPLLMQMTAEPAGSERSTRHLLTVTGDLWETRDRGAREGGREREREEGRGRPGSQYRGGGRSANCREFTFYCARPRQTAGLSSRSFPDLYSFPIFYYVADT